MNKEFMIIDNIPVAINGEKNLLELIRKAGIELPTFCYYSELSVYGACRMCMVENKWGGMEAACSTPPRNGMEIYTNTPKAEKIPQDDIGTSSFKSLRRMYDLR